jgi:glycosyltransferase involved in cell wall biosynthesis
LNDGVHNRNPYSVSVIIPAHNASEYIGRAIESVLAQTRKPDEIIVIDDGSVDNTAEVTKKYKSIRYIHQENAGPSIARNIGIEAATSEWIAFLDADDEWIPEKLELQTELLRRNTNLVWTTSNFIRCLCDEDRRAPDIDLKQGQEALHGKEYFGDFFQTSLPRGYGCTITKLIKKSVLKEVGGFRVGQHVGEDTDLWFRIAYRWPSIGYINQPLAIYHMNVTESLTQKKDWLKFVSEMLKRHLKLAAEYGRLDAYKPFATYAVTSWIRGLIFENKPAEIRRLLGEFEELLTFRFKTIVRLLLICPGATAMICHFISRIVRTLNLRKKIMRRPKRS